MQCNIVLFQKKKVHIVVLTSCTNHVYFSRLAILCSITQLDSYINNVKFVFENINHREVSNILLNIRNLYFFIVHDDRTQKFEYTLQESS